MERTTSTVAEWLIQDELADYTAANFFLEDTVRDFVRDMNNFQYSLELLYESQKHIQSDLLNRIQSLRGCIPVIQDIRVIVIVPPIPSANIQQFPQEPQFADVPTQFTIPMPHET